MAMDNELIGLVERTWARDAAELAGVLAEQDSSWRSEAFELSGGYAVLCGAGLYVNQALAVGLADPITEDELTQLRDRSAAVGVHPAIETTPATHPDTLELIEASGFGAAEETTSVLVLDVEPPRADRGAGDIVVVPVSERSLGEWQETSAAGWGHSSEPARRAADAYARAAHVLDGDGMVIAVNPIDGRPLGCASLTFRDNVATLGGMSTMPNERGRGVQSVLIQHRIDVARGLGARIIASSAQTGSTSERNLRRHGFKPSHLKVIHVHPQ